MAKKQQYPNSKDDDAITKSVEELMGPTPDTALPASTPPTKIMVQDEPSTAPLVDDTALSAAVAPSDSTEMSSDDSTADSNATEHQPTNDDAATEDNQPTDEAAADSLDTTSEQKETANGIDTEAADDPETAEAVDDIVAAESDELLKAEDERVAATFTPTKPSRSDKFKHFFGAWWHNKKARYGTIALIVFTVATIAAVPTSRYMVLNTAGVRSGASLTVLDNSTQLPLRNVQVSVGGTSGLTDKNGYIRLNGLKLGRTELVVARTAFAEVRRPLTLGWGSNPLGSYRLTAVGAQYTFVVKDFMSGKPIEKAEAVAGNSSAFSDKDGKIVLTVDKPGESEISLTIKSDTYRDESVRIPVDSVGEHAVQLVPERKHVFISKRSGKYDVYKIDIDGQNEELLLAGTGHERDDMVLVPHPTDDVVALVSTRDNERNSDKFLMSTLTLIDVTTGETTDLVRSERVQIVDWLGDRLVYVQIAAGASAENPQRHRLTAYNYKKDDKTELASSNYFNDVMVADGSVYYAPSLSASNGVSGLFKVAANGTGRQTLLDKEAWNIFRVSHDVLHVSVQQEWYGYRLGEDKATKLEGAPANAKTRIYADNASGTKSLWVEERDGKGVLLSYDTEKDADTVLKAQSGLQNPVYWLNDDYLVYRIHTDQESADYVLNTDGGEPRKIRDVTNTGGVDRWYYY